MEEKHEDVDDVGSASGDSFIDDSEDDGPSTSGKDDQFHLEEPLTEQEIEDLVAEFLEVESKAAEAQEALEKESLAKVESEVREELALTLNGDDLETAIANEMATFVEEWEVVLDELEIESAHLLEQLDGAGIELPSLYKLIESQASNGCFTEAWKKRVHWVGSQVTGDLLASVSNAEKTLQIERPVRRRHGKLLEEGASGYLKKKFSTHEIEGIGTENLEVDWCSLNKVFSEGSKDNDTLFGSKNWASVYLASTPQQAAEMGLKFPGVDEVEEIDDVDGNSCDPFVAAAIENEKELDLSEEQKKNFRKVKEEDDAIFDRKLQMRLKQKRYQKRCKQEVFQKDVSPRVEEQPVSLVDCLNHVSDDKTDGRGMGFSDDENGDACHKIKIDIPNGSDASSDIDMERSMEHMASVLPSALSDFVEPLGSKRLNDMEELTTQTKKSRTNGVHNDESSLIKEDSAFNLTTLNTICNTEQNDHGADSLPSERPNEKIRCTACDQVVIKAYAHPFLKVIVCADCKCLMDDKKNVKEPDCSECYCGWCGCNADLVSCKSCKTLFCVGCIRRNLGVECLLKAQASGWHCCCCRPSLLQPLTTQLEEALGSGELTGSSSDSDSDNPNADINVTISSKRKRKKKIRRILDDAELGEDTRKKIAIEKERQERLKSLQVQFSSNSKMMSSAGFCGNLSEGASAEVLGDASTGYIVNVVREKGEEAVRIPPSISSKLKTHQISGIRFMWENIIQSIRKVKSGDKGLGCILAHTMGLGKTFQVIAFLYTAMRSADLGLRTALIVTPVNVLHNWRQEFFKWKPSELKPLRIFMLEDVTRIRTRGETIGRARMIDGLYYFDEVSTSHKKIQGLSSLYIEGYLQAMLDTMYKQEYLRVRVIDNQVILKNLPPNTRLVNEIVQRVKEFLVSRALLKGDSGMISRPFHHLRRESEWKIGPTVLTLCEHLFVSFAIRILRKGVARIVVRIPWNKESNSDSQETNLSLVPTGKVPKGKFIWTMGIGKFMLSGILAYIDGTLCRNIPCPIVRRIVSGFLLSLLDNNDKE